jgi:hypothetical protein
MNKHIMQLIRERFYPLVRFCGPQSAGEVEVEGVRRTVLPRRALDLVVAGQKLSQWSSLR